MQILPASTKPVARISHGSSPTNRNGRASNTRGATWTLQSIRGTKARMQGTHASRDWHYPTLSGSPHPPFFGLASYESFYISRPGTVPPRSPPHHPQERCISATADRIICAALFPSCTLLHTPLALPALDPKPQTRDSLARDHSATPRTICHLPWAARVVFDSFPDPR